MSYRVYLVQELNKDDFDLLLEFCEDIMDRINRNQILLNNILFSDGATFMTNGTVLLIGIIVCIGTTATWTGKVRLIVQTKMFGQVLLETNLKAHKCCLLRRNAP